MKEYRVRWNGQERVVTVAQDAVAKHLDDEGDLDLGQDRVRGYIERGGIESMTHGDFWVELNVELTWRVKVSSAQTEPMAIAAATSELIGFLGDNICCGEVEATVL